MRRATSSLIGIGYFFRIFVQNGKYHENKTEESDRRRQYDASETEYVGIVMFGGGTGSGHQCETENDHDKSNRYQQ